MRVLVAGESPVERRFATALLSVLGHESDSVASEREAAEASTRRHYDLMLLDVDRRPRLVGESGASRGLSQPPTLDELEAALVGLAPVSTRQ